MDVLSNYIATYLDICLNIVFLVWVVLTFVLTLFEVSVDPCWRPVVLHHSCENVAQMLLRSNVTEETVLLTSDLCQMFHRFFKMHFKLDIIHVCVCVCMYVCNYFPICYRVY